MQPQLQCKHKVSGIQAGDEVNNMTLPDDHYYGILLNDQYYDEIPEEQHDIVAGNVNVNSHNQSSCALRQYLLG